MSEITTTWEKVKNEYIARYYKHYTKYLENPNDLVNKGAMLENCYVLINVFGCSEKYILEIERYGFPKEQLKQDNDYYIIKEEELDISTDVEVEKLSFTAAISTFNEIAYKVKEIWLGQDSSVYEWNHNNCGWSVSEQEKV